MPAIVAGMSEYIRSQIEARRKKLADAERQILILRAELHAYEDALAHMLGEPTHVSEPASRPKRAMPEDRSGQGRSLQATSSAIVIAAVRAYPGAITIDDAIDAVTASTGEAAKRHNVRSSCWTNANAGLIERISDGVFKATAEGARRVGMPLLVAENNTNGANAATQTEGEAERVEGDQGRIEADLLLGAGEPNL